MKKLLILLVFLAGCCSHGDLRADLARAIARRQAMKKVAKHEETKKLCDLDVETFTRLDFVLGGEDPEGGK